MLIRTKVLTAGQPAAMARADALELNTKYSPPGLGQGRAQAPGGVRTAAANASQQVPREEAP
ncbi:MAG: hypothetical protein HYX52_08100 [Chloroflexi bacterium]|nr:hypothetical protein [Chloroflexota bacterium]